jgi:hypothetical protein
MSETPSFGFGKFVPGFDFLQNIAKGGGSQAMPQMPGLSNWVAPTLNVEELEKRISELKAVRFWLEQNSTALGATIQALEVQKMTLATLKGMNVKVGELAEALTLKTPKAEAAAAADAGGAAVDPLQWWGALTQQFQEIAATAMQDVAQKTAANGARRAAAAQPAPAGNGGAATAAPAKKAAARKKPARKAAGKGSGARKAAAD